MENRPADVFPSGFPYGFLLAMPLKTGEEGKNFALHFFDCQLLHPGTDPQR